jgi:hypothetical protein
VLVNRIFKSFLFGLVKLLVEASLLLFVGSLMYLVLSGRENIGLETWNKI